MSIRAMAIALLGIVVIASAIEVVLARHQARRLFAEIQALERERDVLNEEWGRLQLEQSTWTTASRIEDVARTELNMRAPAAGEIMLVPQ
jgi:cell division protein FtsL